MPPPMEHVSGLIPPDHHRAIAEIGGTDGISAGLRAVVAAGIATLQGDGPAILGAVDELERLTDRLAAVVGRTTVSGAWWAPSDAAMPEREQLAPMGDVVASPARVVLAGSTGALLVDLKSGSLEAQNGTACAVVPLELRDLVGVAAILPAALVRLSNLGPGTETLADHFTVARLDCGLVRFTLRGVNVEAHAQAALSFGVELLALVCRGVADGIAVREALNRQLEATP